MGTAKAAATPWREGPFRTRQPGLVFGTMYEDAGIELRAFAPQSRVFCIAAAGCTARALAAAGHSVTAVDINPQQIAYAQARAAGHPPQRGSVDRLMVRGRQLMTLCGWTRARLTEFLALSDTAEQLDYWDRCLDTRRWRMVLDTLLTPRLLGSRYAQAMLEALPRDFGRQMRERLRRGWGRHGNKDNPYAAALLLGAPPAEHGMPQLPIQFACAEAAEYLESCLPNSFDAFTVSNITDGASPSYQRRLFAAIEGAAAAKAVVVTRTFAQQADSTSGGRVEDWTAFDRSLLWDCVAVRRMGGGDA